MIRRLTSIYLLAFALAVSCLQAQRAAGNDQVRAAASAGRRLGTVARVLLISVDGFHAIDLANYVKSNPSSTLAKLSNTGITYTNASTPTPSDSFPGLMALITGGSPVSTGVWYDNSYDRSLSPPINGAAQSNGANQCPAVVGTQVLFDETIDKDLTRLDGGGGIDTTRLPMDPRNACTLVYPHNYLRVNTIFEVAKAAGLYTAWSDKHVGAYEIVNGPSGTGVDDLYSPEINSNISSASPPPSCTGTIWTDSICAVEFYDNLKVQAILHEIDGFDHTGTVHTQIPAIFGMNFQSVSVGQKLASDPAGPTGYADVNGTPNGGLLSAIGFVDSSLGQMVAELSKNNLLDSTLIIITAKHGQSPIDFNKVNNTALSNGCNPPPAAGAKGGGCRLDDSLYTSQAVPVAQLTDDDVALLWLGPDNQGQTGTLVSALSQPSTELALGIDQIFAGEQLKARYNDPSTDSRTPDVLVKPNYGVIYTGGTKIAEHGGGAEDDTHVALLISNPRMQARAVKTPVTTMQVAPAILQALHLKPILLQAVQIEKTRSLPGLFLELPVFLRLISLTP
jgi:hypothetical protein